MSHAREKGTTGLMALEGAGPAWQGGNVREVDGFPFVCSSHGVVDMWLTCPRRLGKVAFPRTSRRHESQAGANGLAASSPSPPDQPVLMDRGQRNPDLLPIGVLDEPVAFVQQGL